MQNPFLKWAGNKLPIIQRIQELLPPGQKFIEPFVGAGSVFMNVDYPKYVINDANQDLIDVYTALVASPQIFITSCLCYFTPEFRTPEAYYQIRDEFNKTREPILFVYLNKHGFHGLCRYNASGEFNAPYGHYKFPGLNTATMLAYAAKLHDATICNGDFEHVMERAKAGDVIYADPPYDPLSKTANFTSYNAGGFTCKDQVRLANAARRAQRRGATVLISNHNTPFICELYKGAEIVEFDVQRRFANRAEDRIEAPEILALFRGDA